MRGLRQAALLCGTLILVHAATAPIGARAEVAPRATHAAVPLEHRTWEQTSLPRSAARPGRAFARVGVRPAHRTSASSWMRVAAGEAAAGDSAARSVLHAADASLDRFHLTSIRLWLYRNFLPDSKHNDIFGVAIRSAWGIGRFDFSNVTYFELADYQESVPGRPFGNAQPLPGGGTGLTDLLSGFFVSPKRAQHGAHHFAAGFALNVPSGTDAALSSGKWMIGPAVEYSYQRGRFLAAFIGMQIWSFGGDPNRDYVSLFMIKPELKYNLAPRWKLVHMPYGVSVYWTHDSVKKVYLPLGGGVQYAFNIGSQKMAASLQAFKYVLRSDNGPEADIRFMLEFSF